MIIHSIVPAETLYEGIEQLKAPEEVRHKGILMQVEKLEGGQAKIVRLLSPDPMIYLDPALAPGQTIRLVSET